jgi:hypothetical protein
VRFEESSADLDAAMTASTGDTEIVGGRLVINSRKGIETVRHSTRNVSVLVVTLLAPFWTSCGSHEASTTTTSTPSTSAVRILLSPL